LSISRRSLKITDSSISLGMIESHTLSKSPKPRIRKGVSRTISGPARWIHFTMRPDRDLASVDLAATFSEVTDEFFACVQLRARWLVAIKISHQTNAERNVI